MALIGMMIIICLVSAALWTVGGFYLIFLDEIWKGIICCALAALILIGGLAYVSEIKQTDQRAKLADQYTCPTGSFFRTLHGEPICWTLAKPKGGLQ